MLYKGIEVKTSYLIEEAILHYQYLFDNRISKLEEILKKIYRIDECLS